MPVRVVIMLTDSPCSDQAQRLARSAEPHLDLGAHRDELDVRAEDLGQERIALVSAVETHLFTEKARGHTNADRALDCNGRGVSSRDGRHLG